MGKDTVVFRSEVGLSVKNPLMKYPEEVRKYYLQYGSCEVLHNVCKKLLNSTQYVVILQFKQSAHANQVKQKYNGRVLGETRVTTCWFDAKQARELGLPPPPLNQTKKGPQWNRYMDDSLSISSQDSVRGALTSQDFSESDSSQVLGRLSPEMEQSNTPVLRRSRGSPPARSLSKERHDSLERPDSQLSTYSHSSRERGQAERRERTSARERSESLSSSRYSIRFGSRSTAEEKDFSHHSEGGTRKRRASSPASYSGPKRSKEDMAADERKTNIFDRLGPSSSLKEKQHQLEPISEVYSTSSGAKGSSSGGHSRSSQLSERYHTSPGPSSDYEQRSYLGEYMPRRRGRELIAVKEEEFGEKSSEGRERRRKTRSEGYREVEREERERGRGRERESVWEREREKERSRERHRERKREEDMMKEDRRQSRGGGTERQWQRERGFESEGDILWEHEMDDARERREEDSERGGRQNTDGRGEEEWKCVEEAVDGVKSDRNVSTFGEVVDSVQLNLEDYGEEIIEKKLMDKTGEKEEEDERRRSEEKKARDKEKARHRKGRERREKGKKTKSVPEIKEEIVVSDTETQLISEVVREKSADDTLSPVALPESRDYNDRDVTPPLEVLQSLQNSYQQTYYPGQFHPLPVPTSSDLPYQLFGGHEHLQQLPHPAQSDSALPTTSLGYQVGTQSGSGVIPTAGVWPMPAPAGVSPAQWQLWLQSLEKQRSVATGTSVLTTTTASETQASSEQLGGSLEGVSVPTTTESGTQAETTPPEVEATPPQPRLSVSSLNAEQAAPPQQKRKLDAKCKAHYREMMQTFKTHAAVLAMATKLMIQENPDNQLVLEEALESSLCRFARTLLEKFQQQT